MITLEPFAGLANRLRTIDSGILLANKVNRALQIDWILNRDLNCPFNQLFKPIDGILINDSINLKWPHTKSYKLHVLLKSFKYDKAFRTRKEVDQLPKINDLNHYLDKYNSIFISSCDSFYGSSNDYRYLNPVDEISEKVEKIKATFSEYCIGLHIRRSDHAIATHNSKTESFVALMKWAIENNHQTSFFLATDSIKEESALKQLFPGRIVTAPKILDRNSPKGIQEALVDLLCLSKTNKIYGCSMSSFSCAASYFGQVPIEFIDETFTI